jgi:hypothetical protein
MSVETEYQYLREVHKAQAQQRLVSATQIVKWLKRHITIESAIDIGCGDGHMLKALHDAGTTDLVGVDGYCSESYLLDPETHRTHDLNHSLQIPRSFDLCICLEVGEHLAPASGPILVDTCVSHSEVILWSAAIPGQGGTQHVNEQWPTWWLSFFRQHDYVAIDAIRPAIWYNHQVAWWLRQNTILYVARDRLQRDYKLNALHGMNHRAPFDIVHPGFVSGAAR